MRLGTQRKANRRQKGTNRNRYGNHMLPREEGRDQVYLVIMVVGFVRGGLAVLLMGITNIQSILHPCELWKLEIHNITFRHVDMQMFCPFLFPSFYSAMYCTSARIYPTVTTLTLTQIHQKHRTHCSPRPTPNTSRLSSKTRKKRPVALPLGTCCLV